MPEARICDERIDPGDVLRGGLVSGNPSLREVPVAAADDAGTKRAGNSRLGKPALFARCVRGCLDLTRARDLVLKIALLAPRQFDGSEGCRVPRHHFIPKPIGTALTISASACWQ